MFERRHDKLLTRREFARRMAQFTGLASALVALSLALGVVGYHLFADLPWIDSLLNASMILTGMGPVDPLHTAAAKLWASAYALFSGVIFLTVAATLIAPIMHRFLHHFHLEEAEADKKSAKKR